MTPTNPIRELAQALNPAEPAFGLPFQLTAPIDRTVRERQTSLFTSVTDQPRAADPAPITTSDTTMTISIIPNELRAPAGKLADAELHFTDGPLAGLKLIGFGIWERRTGSGRNVTFPARTYAVNGERRSFALLRPTSDPDSHDRIRDLILAAYAEQEQRAAV